MALSDGMKRLLLVLNIFHVALSVILACASIWLFVEVQQVTQWRNPVHYQLDYNVYWPQIIPWMFFFAALLAISTSACGFSGMKQRSKCLLVTFTISQAVTVGILILVAIVALVFGNGEAARYFIQDTIWDVYKQFSEARVQDNAFNSMERRFSCCGANGPRDYKGSSFSEFPRSCCDTYYRGFLDFHPIQCGFSDRAPNERHGCVETSVNYAQIFNIALATGAFLIAAIGAINLVVGSSLARTVKKRPIVVKQIESESKKGLL